MNIKSKLEKWAGLQTLGDDDRGQPGEVKLAYKPGSVQGIPLGSHSSGPTVTRRLKRPTREQREPRYRSPIWPCSGWGLACRSCCQARGGLLPHRFTIAGPAFGT